MDGRVSLRSRVCSVHEQQGSMLIHKITGLEPFGKCSKLQELYLRKNEKLVPFVHPLLTCAAALSFMSLKCTHYPLTTHWRHQVKSLDELKHLTPLQGLKVLWLCDNPCAETSDYRA
eukprot:1742158-Pyramimonas_sp.AAC.1